MSNHECISGNLRFRMLNVVCRVGNLESRIFNVECRFQIALSRFTIFASLFGTRR